MIASSKGHMMSRRNHGPRLLWGLVALAVAGCPSTQRTPDPGPQQKPETVAPLKPEEQFTNRSLRLFEDAVRAYQEQKQLKVFDWELLERKFKAVLVGDDLFAEAYLNLGVVYERQRRTDDAITAYRAALQRKPSLKEAAVNLALIYQAQGRPADSLALLTDVMRYYPDDGEVRARIAEVYREGGDTQQAMKLSREALMREPQNLTAHKVMMRAYLDRNNLSMARLVALRATKIAASDPELYYTMGLILQRQGDEQGAILQYRRALEERGEFVAARVKLAAIAAEHEDWTNVAVQLQKVVELDPNNADARLNLGIAFKGLGEFDKAMAEYDAALKANPDLTLVHFNMGVLFQRHKDAPEKALEHYRTFMTKAGNVPANHPVLEFIRDCEQYLRQLEEAKAAEERAKLEKQAAEERAKKEAELKAKLEAEEKARQEAAEKAAQPGLEKGAEGGSPGKAEEPTPGQPAPEPAGKPAEPSTKPAEAAPPEGKPAEAPRTQVQPDEPDDPL